MYVNGDLFLVVLAPVENQAATLKVRTPKHHMVSELGLLGPGGCRR